MGAACADWTRPSSRALSRILMKEFIGDCLGIWYSARRLNLRETRETCEKSETGKMGGGFESVFSRLSRLSEVPAMAAEVFMSNVG